MATGDLKMVYAASSNLTVTNLGAIVSDTTFKAGWQSAAIDNTVNLYLDYRVTAKVQIGAAGMAAGEIRMYLVAMLDDTNWPDNITGSEAVRTFSDTEQRDGAAKIAAGVITDADASGVYYLDCPSVAAIFGGNVPAKFVVFITHSTVANLAAAGSQQVTVKGSYLNLAA